MAPQAGVDHHVLRLAERGKRVEQTLAPMGDEVRQRAVLRHLHVLGSLLLFHAERVLHGIVGRGDGGVFRLALHGGEETAPTGVVALVLRQAREGRKLVHDARAQGAVPGFQQRVRRCAYELGGVVPHGVRAARALRPHEAHVRGVLRGQRHEQALLHATETGHAHHLLGIVEALGGRQQLLARDDHLAVGLRARAQARLQQLGIVGPMRFERARRADGGARAAADALLRRDNQLVIVVGDASGRAHFRALHARCVAVAHDGAAVLMDRDVCAL